MNSKTLYFEQQCFSRNQFEQQSLSLLFNQIFGFQMLEIPIFSARALRALAYTNNFWLLPRPQNTCL
jgi:hypothetical protein